MEVAEHTPWLERAVQIDGNHFFVDDERVLVAHFGQDHVARPDLVDIAFRRTRAASADDHPVFVGIVVVRLDNVANLQRVDAVVNL